MRGALDRHPAIQPTEKPRASTLDKRTPQDPPASLAGSIALCQSQVDTGISSVLATSIYNAHVAGRGGAGL